MSVAYIMLVIGTVLVSISLWELKRFRDESAKEMDNLKVMKREIHRAKSDVEKLLLELNKASERAVQEIAEKIDESRNYIPVEIAAAEELAAEEDKNDELDGQIAMEFSVEPYQIPEKHLMIYHLAEQGLSTEEIAQRIKLGKGEVALILNLHNRSDQKHVQILQ